MMPKERALSIGLYQCYCIGDKICEYHQGLIEEISEAVEAEREACAQLMDDLGATYESVDGQERVGNVIGDVISIHAAGDAIRARGNDA
jgi:hypothetical protein